jgi:triacylglycerol lipase
MIDPAHQTPTLPTHNPLTKPKTNQPPIDKRISGLLKKGILNKSFAGEAIRRTVFSLIAIPSALAMGLLSLVGLPIILASKTIDACRVQKNPLHKAAMFIKSLAREAFALLSLVGSLPLDLERLNPSESECVQGETPILLVHGFLGSSCHWTYVRKQLMMSKKTNVFTVNLGDPRLGIQEYTEILREKIKEIKDKTGSQQVFLVGHSMGGLVCKEYAKKDSASIKKIITIGSPLEGSQMARCGAFFSRAAQDMIPHSPFLQGQEGSCVPEKHIASSLDEMVIPNSSAKGHDGKATIIDDASHGGLLFSKKTVRSLIRALDETENT